jgi:TnpA family transposase
MPAIIVSNEARSAVLRLTKAQRIAHGVSRGSTGFLAVESVGVFTIEVKSANSGDVARMNEHSIALLECGTDSPIDIPERATRVLAN